LLDVNGIEQRSKNAPNRALLQLLKQTNGIGYPAPRKRACGRSVGFLLTGAISRA